MIIFPIVIGLLLLNSNSSEEIGGVLLYKLDLLISKINKKVKHLA